MTIVKRPNTIDQKMDGARLKEVHIELQQQHFVMEIEETAYFFFDKLYNTDKDQMN